MKKIDTFSIICAIYPLLVLMFTTEPTEPGFASPGLLLYALGWLIVLGVAVVSIPFRWKAKKWESFLPLGGFAAALALSSIFLLAGSVAYNRKQEPRRNAEDDYWGLINISPPPILEQTNWFQQPPAGDSLKAAPED